MPEVAHAGEYHGEAQLVRRRHFFIADRPAGLDHRGNTVLGGLVDTSGKGENASDATTAPCNGSRAFNAPHPH